ncbi:MAG TPA: ABC transporter substrate-binding protein [Xanthobacteraceae bacterium]|jgi:ABC-type Fe3+ transport system substrate-binding protein
MGRMTRRQAAALGVVAAFGGLAGGRLHGQPDWTSAGAVQDLHAKAKAEGEVVLWGPQQRELSWIPDEFSKRFPGITVNWSADLSAPTKIIAEARAGRHAVDVNINSLGGVHPIAERDLLGQIDWSLFGVTSANVFHDGRAAATHNPVYGVVYNSSLVREEELPRTWDDLLHDRWKSRLVTSQFLFPRMLGFLAMEWGEAKTEEFARSLLDANDLLVTRAPRESLLRTGERHMSVAEFVSGGRFWKQEGMPVDGHYVSPYPAVQFISARMKTAPHPNAATLLAGWLVTDEAKRRREQLRFDGDLRAGSKSAIYAELTQRGGRLLIEDTSNMVLREEAYKKLSQLVSGRGR